MKSSDGVVLLHGMCRSSASMVRLERALVEKGFVVLNVDYPSRTASVEMLSGAVVSAALAAEQLKDCPRIHFVTHSLGGILVRAYFKRGFDARLGRVVMLGPPNQGSEVVDKLKSWWLFKRVNGPAGSQLGTDPDSIPQRLGPVDFELGVIAGDRSINWINSLMINGPDDGKVSVARTKVEGMKEHLVVHATHPFIMKSRRVADSVIRFLEFGSFSSAAGRAGAVNGGVNQ